MASDYGSATNHPHPPVHNTALTDNLPPPPSYEEAISTAPTPNAPAPYHATSQHPAPSTAPYPSATPYSYPISITTCKPVPTASCPTPPYPVSPSFPRPTPSQSSSTPTQITSAPAVLVQQPREQDGTSPFTRCVLVIGASMIVSIVMYLLKALIFSFM
ncbi:uncharacterized protein LOC135115644 [Scylla paramamosain]|uniref:uncharacterized protein LOC135115644 n=1 Tax=Scylla paramamosain TaxID=85552 RepID=UPI003082F38F